MAVLSDWEHLSAYSGTVWLLYPSKRFLATKLRVWMDPVVAGLAATGLSGALEASASRSMGWLCAFSGTGRAARQRCRNILHPLNSDESLLM